MLLDLYRKKKNLKKKRKGPALHLKNFKFLIKDS